MQTFPLLSTWSTKGLLLQPLTCFSRDPRLTALFNEKHSLSVRRTEDGTRKCLQLHTVFSQTAVLKQQRNVFLPNLLKEIKEFRRTPNPVLPRRLNSFPVSHDLWPYSFLSICNNKKTFDIVLEIFYLYHDIQLWNIPSSYTVTLIYILEIKHFPTET